MAAMSDEERNAWRALKGQDLSGPPLRDDERFVAPNRQARERYIRFATQAAQFYHGDRPVRFHGDCWKL